MCSHEVKDWEYLRGTPTFTINQIRQYLKGLLPQSITESAFLRAQLEPINQPSLYTDMVAELFDVKRPEFDDWDKEDLLCTSCLTIFVGEHLHLWLLERKRASGRQVPEDCWYGYNCRTQTHRREHAEKLNVSCLHLLFAGSHCHRTASEPSDTGVNVPTTVLLPGRESFP